MSWPILMLAEKPSMAFEISKIIAGDWVDTDKTGPTPVHRFVATMKYWEGHDIVFGSVTGHLFEYKLPVEYEDWKRDPKDLFTCPLERHPLRPELHHHIEDLSLEARSVVLWMDNDREGEAICFEVMEIIKNKFAKMGKNMKPGFFYRATTSAVTPNDIRRATSNIRAPDSNVSDASLARQELDMRIGFAFTRLLTRSLKPVAPSLFEKVVSFGPCQTPALALCVDGEGTKCDLKLKTKGGETMRVNCVPVTETGGKPSEAASKQHTSGGNKITIISERVETVVIRPPPALNTVTLLKLASSKFNIPPLDVMNIAESLYLRGLISYPRTETTFYPLEMDYKAILTKLSECFELGERIEALAEHVEEQIMKANDRKGAKDAGDHPPIIPIVTRSMFGETVKSLGERDKMIFLLVFRTFIASLSHHAKVDRKEVTFSYCGRVYKTISEKAVKKGHLRYLNTLKRNKFSIEDLGSSNVECVTSHGINESELIDIMDKKGIGTDASIANHINALYERGLCELNTKREVKPSKKGLCIIRVLERFVPELVDTDLRKKMEERLLSIEQGKPATEVVRECLGEYMGKFIKLENDMDLVKEFVRFFVAK